ncbi:MAG TPA: hypothetical protein VK636_07780 [Gemmatimonadaceae bacterium]|nr:hypothetical protein [Gemmatimonadaceae bacterium]
MPSRKTARAIGWAGGRRNEACGSEARHQDSAHDEHNIKDPRRRPHVVSGQVRKI